MQELSAEGDQGSLYYVARALVRLQALLGTIPRLKGKGPGAAAVRGMLARMRREQGAAAPAAGALLVATGQLNPSRQPGWGVHWRDHYVGMLHVQQESGLPVQFSKGG